MIGFIFDNSKYLAILLGIALTYPLMWQRRIRAGTEDWYQILAMCFGFSLISLIGTILMANLERLLSGEGFSPGSVSVSGVYLIAAPILLLLCRIMKRDRSDIFDLFAVYVLPTLFLMRINCLMSGCCQGALIGDSAFRWPTREEEMVFYAAMLIFLIRQEKAGKARGKRFPELMMAYGVFRFICEFFRESDRGGVFHMAHIWAALIFLLGYSFYTENKTRISHGSNKQSKAGGRRV